MRSLFTILTVSSFALIVADEKCNADGGLSKVTVDGKTYDFSSFLKGENHSTDQGPDGTTYNYHMCMCKTCSETCDGAAIPTGSFVQTYTDASGMSQCYVTAKWDNTGKWSKYDGGVQVVYDNGEDCGNGNNRQTTIKFQCDPSVGEVPKDNSWKVTNFSCDYTAIVPTNDACDGTEGMGWSGAFLIALASTFAVYFAVGFIYNYKVEGSGLGAESIPHREFWQQFPGLVRDGVVMTYERFDRLRHGTLNKRGIPSADMCSGVMHTPDDAEYGTSSGNLGAGLLDGKKKPISADDI
eukprot:g1869.t1